MPSTTVLQIDGIEVFYEQVTVRARCLACADTMERP